MTVTVVTSSHMTVDSARPTALTVPVWQPASANDSEHRPRRAGTLCRAGPGTGPAFPRPATRSHCADGAQAPPGLGPWTASELTPGLSGPSGGQGPINARLGPDRPAVARPYNAGLEITQAGHGTQSRWSRSARHCHGPSPGLSRPAIRLGVVPGSFTRGPPPGREGLSHRDRDGQAQLEYSR
jgi:hypothetical protein